MLVFPVFYALLGMSTGLGSTIKTAVQVEIRSYFSTLLVISTALGPPVFGYFLDRDYSFNFIMLLFAAITLMSIIFSFKLKVSTI
jgi:hypothetical protein